jgi:chemotaxis protein CheX
VVSEISKDELMTVVDELFGSMAGMQLTPCANVVHPNKITGYIVAAVQIVGSWQGAVRLDLDIELARQACAGLVGVDPADLLQDDVRDAAGELANITGGSIKTLLGPTCGLSLPSVVIGQNFEFSLPHGKLLQESSFSHASGILLISIIEKPGAS